MFHFECMSQPFIIFTLSAAFFLSAWPITCGQEVNDKNSSSPLVFGLVKEEREKKVLGVLTFCHCYCFSPLRSLVRGRLSFRRRKHKTEKRDFGQQNPFHRKKATTTCRLLLWIFIRFCAFSFCCVRWKLRVIKHHWNHYFTAKCNYELGTKGEAHKQLKLARGFTQQRN